MRRVTTSFRFQLTLKASTGSPHKKLCVFKPLRCYGRTRRLLLLVQDAAPEMYSLRIDLIPRTTGISLEVDSAATSSPSLHLLEREDNICIMICKVPAFIHCQLRKKTQSQRQGSEVRVTWCLRPACKKRKSPLLKAILCPCSSGKAISASPTKSMTHSSSSCSYT
jgi:hypothetical protein